MRYEDGTQDCERCIEFGRQPPQRVRPDMHDDPIFQGKTTFPLCDPCLRVIHNEAVSGFAEMQPFMRRYLAFVDWRLEHGQDIAA